MTKKTVVQEHHINKKCQNCGKPLPKGRKRYCSLACRRMKVKRICKNCGKEFIVSQKDRTRDYCSRKCHLAKKGSFYKVGYRSERVAFNILKQSGYTVIRSAGSHGIFDLIAFHPDEIKVRLIQVKSTHRLSGYYMFSKARDAISKVELPSYVSKELWIHRRTSRTWEILFLDEDKIVSGRAKTIRKYLRNEPSEIVAFNLSAFLKKNEAVELRKST